MHRKLESQTLCEKCSFSELFWSVFSGIRTGYRKMRTRITQHTDNFYPVKCQKQNSNKMMVLTDILIIKVH